MPRLCALIVVLSITGTPNLSQTQERVVVNAIKPQKKTNQNNNNNFAQE
jgi:hypothetical protein